ncbi:MAG: branched-chain amino acid transport system permease protein [Actinobacteria bacterium]|jgi:branched-chain amino acid transport system permease protein|nr:branched-chain amino acid transport system permease protein [Actinomycetota bacterium]
MFVVLIDQFWSLTIAGLALGFIYVLISLGYTMVYGVLRMINFANSEIFMWGTFGTVITNRDLYNYTQTSEPATGWKLALVLITALLMSMFIAGLTAVFVEFVAYRRLRMKGTNRLATLISAIGISIVLQEVMRLLTDSRPVGSPRVLEKIILAEVWGANLRLDTIITIIAAAVIFFILERFIKLSRMGKAIRAVSQNEDAAKLMGVNLNRVITTTFLVGGLATGAAAFFYTTVFEYTKFNIGFTMGLAAFTAAVLGGIGNIRGAFYGGISLGLLEVYASAVLGTQWKAVTVFVVLVLVLLFKPNGLFGEAVQQTRA